MSFLDNLLLGASGVTSLGGLVRNVFGGGEDRARAERERVLAEMQRGGMTDYLTGARQDARTLYGMSGAGSDAVRSLGSNLGASLAGAGVTNASSIAGAQGLALQGEQAAIANYGAQLQAAREQQLANNRNQVNSLRLGYADQDAQRAQQQRGNAVQGFQSFLGSLSQYNNARSGVNRAQLYTPQQNGTQNKTDYFATSGGGSLLTPGYQMKGTAPKRPSLLQQSDRYGNTFYGSS